MGIFDTAKRFIEEKIKPVVQRVRQVFQPAPQPSVPRQTPAPQASLLPGARSVYTPPPVQSFQPQASLLPGARAAYTPPAPSGIRTAAPSYTPPRQTSSITAAAQRALSGLSESIRGLTQRSRESQFATSFRS